MSCASTWTGRTPGKAYAVPKDNPFVGLADVRPEIWAFGFRNPWKMTFDRATGDLWLGDVGWEMWEMVYQIQARAATTAGRSRRARNRCEPDEKIGPTPILPPTVAFPHTEAASITGGYVYRGKKHKDLVGAYVCGDWMSRKYWAIRAEGEKPATTIEIAQGSPKVVSFAEDNDGELYILDYNETAGIYTLEPNPDAGKPRPPFPTKLSETGLFADRGSCNVPAAGVYPYAINAEPWADHATAKRLVGAAGDQFGDVLSSRRAGARHGVVQVACLLPQGRRAGPDVHVWRWKQTGTRHPAGDPRRLETQILHFDGREWRGYTYRWNDAQTDATLVPAAGEDVELTVQGRQGARRHAETDVALPEPDGVPAVPQPVGRRGTRLHRGSAQATQVSRMAPRMS